MADSVISSGQEDAPARREPTLPPCSLPPRFLHELEGTIANATNGDLQHTINLLTAFCILAQGDHPPPAALVRWIGKFLYHACDSEWLRQARRNRSIRHQTARSRNTIGVAESLRSLAGGRNPGISRLTQIYYGQAGTTDLAEFIDTAARNGTPSANCLKAACAAASRLRHILLRDDPTGFNHRSKVGIRGWGAWKSSDEFHSEIADELTRAAATRGRSLAALFREIGPRFGLTSEGVKKIWQRAQRQRK
ncbi:hypothetical protein GPA27_01810 [Aromatoleum toluolicum]|uniref:Uncharacterized protein n=1 Tax=Aromatoleum toluolicum TaxID=90060 RepID=A0ABX1NA19_9RHOO|nr:hypothetical protein [Aromatoleum toluolicum]NMF96133.1 hypothetical protein [Aromatoleum toluolicum]